MSEHHSSPSSFLSSESPIFLWISVSWILFGSEATEALLKTTTFPWTMDASTKFSRWDTALMSSSLVIFYRLIWFHYFFLFFHFHDIILTFEVNLTESNGVNRRLPDDCMTAYSDKEAYLFILHFPGMQVLPLAMGHAYGRHEQRSQWLDRHVYDATCCKAVG